MLKRLMARSPGRMAADRLHDAATRQSRIPALYSRMGAPDTVEGRFELLTLHVILLIDRLRGVPGLAAEVRQTLFDAYVSNLDGALREMGVGDLAVGKRMRRLGEAFYGRATAYDAAFQAPPDSGALEDLIGRTILAGAAGVAGDLADYARRCRQALAEADIDMLVQGEPRWARP